MTTLDGRYETGTPGWVVHVPVMCGHCGNTHLINAEILGLA